MHKGGNGESGIDPKGDGSAECYACGLRFVPEPEGAEVIAITKEDPDVRCEGLPFQHEIYCAVGMTHQFCVQCDARFVPEDLLREARDWMDEAYTEVDWPRELLDRTSDLFRRIDAALGSK